MSTYQMIDNNDQLKKKFENNKEFYARIERDIEYICGIDPISLDSPVLITSAEVLYGVTQRQLEQIGENITNATKEIMEME